MHEPYSRLQEPYSRVEISTPEISTPTSRMYAARSESPQGTCRSNASNTSSRMRSSISDRIGHRPTSAYGEEFFPSDVSKCLGDEALRRPTAELDHGCSELNSRRSSLGGCSEAAFEGRSSREASVEPPGRTSPRVTKTLRFSLEAVLSDTSRESSAAPPAPAEDAASAASAPADTGEGSEEQELLQEKSWFSTLIESPLHSMGCCQDRSKALSPVQQLQQSKGALRLLQQQGPTQTDQEGAAAAFAEFAMLSVQHSHEQTAEGSEPTK